MASPSTRRASSSRPARRRASSWRSSRCSSRAIASRSRCPAIRLIAISSRALGCEPVVIETTQATRWAITPSMLLAAHRKAPLKGVLIASPANPTGTMMTGRGAARSHRRCGRCRDQLHLRRDLSRPRLCVRGRDRGAGVRRRRDHQLVLEIFLHDRLAHRLDGGCRNRWCGRSIACKAISPSRCRRFRRSPPRRHSTAAPRWRR